MSLTKRLLEWNPGPEQTVQIADIELAPTGVALTQRDIDAGRLSRTKGPVLLWLDKSQGEYRVLDGMHRILQAKGRGDVTIQARVTQEPGHYDHARQSIVFK